MRQLSDLKCQSDEAMWSVNVKRGFLSFIQLDMQPNHVERSSEELNMLSKLDIGGRMEDQDRRDLNSYTVYEVDSENRFPDFLFSRQLQDCRFGGTCSWCFVHAWFC